MKVLLQRVNRASVTVNGQIKGAIEKGLLLLTGFGKGDSETVIRKMAEKIAHLRVFPGKDSSFHLSLLDINGDALVVPQFTLYADTKKGRRPDFFNALQPDQAKVLSQKFVAFLKETGIPTVASGIFGAHMVVSLENDGPVTIMVEM
ncbi:MAG: D-tyrosyl-tRNA(Tyr) deacylase [Candidatus Dadabacteria bacterium]|nr:MAG: D-tyrosyl-tRNA(Tyr) deacylase [Candidatus Dadabacteria bacterium]